MPRRIPKPDLRALVAAIQEQTTLGAERLEPHVGTLPFAAERVLRAIVTRAVERGIELQREALADISSLDTPLRPPAPPSPDSQRTTKPQRVKR